MDTSIGILYSDESILVANKPAGIPVIPDGYNPTRPNLRDFVSKEFGQVWTVHRLDKDTSGVLIFARSPEAHRNLNQQFGHHSVQKTYHLLTWGDISWNTIEVDFPLRVDGDRQHRTLIDPKIGKPARTRFIVLQRFQESFNWLTAHPETGYTHQIRAHLAAIGLWLVHDPLYLPHPYPIPPGWHPLHRLELMDKINYLPIQRTALHASAVKFVHPLSCQEITIEAPGPDDIRTSLERLQSH